MDIMKKYMHNYNKIAEVPPTTIKNIPYLSIALLSGFILSQKSPPPAKHWPSSGRSPPERGWLGLHFHLFFTYNSFYIGRAATLDVRRNGSPRELSFVFNRCYRLKALLFSFHSSHFLWQTPKISRRKVRTREAYMKVSLYRGP